MSDAFGNRMKESYEVRSQTFLPRRGYFLMRLDGRSFHTYTKGFDRPYDLQLMEVMDATAKYLCEKITGAKFAYVQSDEITILVTDFDKIETQAWFDGNVQKIVSISAAMATAEFNRLMYLAHPEFLQKGKMAHFDSRVWPIADPYEVENVFIWRQMDARRNSVSMSAQSMFSHKELQGKSTKVMREMMLNAGVDWEQYPAGFCNGRCIVRRSVTEPIGTCRKTDCQTDGCSYSPCYKEEKVTRNKWESEPAPIFVQNRSYLRERMPLIPSFATEEEIAADME